MRISVMIGGAQGSGIETASNILSNAIANWGYYFFAKREYYSNIKGRHSYSQIEVSDSIVFSSRKEYDMLVSFEKETLLHHIFDAKEGAIVIYSTSAAGTLDSAVSMEEEVRERVARTLKASGFTMDVEGALGYLRDVKKARLFPLDYTAIMGEVSRSVQNVDYDTLTKSINMQAMAAAACLLGISLQDFRASISKFLSGRKGGKLAEINLTSADAVYKKLGGQSVFGLKKLEPKKLVQVNGNNVEALAKIASGLRFQSYYPITPASDESTFIEQNSVIGMKDGTPNNIVVLQTEDEIAAITSAIGASLAGARSSTSTSGPGFSLMVEGIGWAGMNEVPLLVSFYMRGGPSTGLPTRNSQSDLLFALNCGHGEVGKIVYSSGRLDDIMQDVALLFNLAEKYQCPVIHLLDKALANSISALPYDALNVGVVGINRGAVYDGDPYSYERFKITESGVSPRANIGKAVFWNTGDEHTEQGHITEDPEVRRRMYEKRIAKMDGILKELPAESKFREYGDKDSDIAVITFGSTVGALIDSFELLRSKGIKAHVVEVKLMEPFPAQEISSILKNKRVIISAESNYVGQLAKVLKQQTGIECNGSMLKWTGRPIDCDEAAMAIEEIVKSGKKRVVLTNGE